MAEADNRKSDIRRWLEYLRDGTDQYESSLRYLREDVRKGGLSLADVGTSEEELEELRVKGCKTGARMWLGHLRNGSDHYDSFLGYLRMEVSKGGLSLADVGTSEEELEELRVKGCKTGARMWLGHLRNGSDHYDSFLGYLRREVSKGGLSLADIGTSEEELASFVPAKS